MREIYKPTQQGGSALGRLMGIGQTALGIIGIPFSGGASALMIPGGLAGAAGGQNEGANALGGISNLAQGAVGMAGSKSSDVAKPPMSSPQSAMQRTGQNQATQLEADKLKNLSNQQIAETFHGAEKELNTLRESNPELAKQYAPILFEGFKQFAPYYRNKVEVARNYQQGIS